ncbi:MAG TPA: ABC transporter permease [Longimicrobiaceae bacterium]
MNFEAVREGVGIALDALRSNKVRAFLTILGIVIGVATVMAMAAVVTGLRSGIMSEIEALGPNNFIVDRYDGTVIQVNDGSQPPPWQGKPPITLEEQRLIAALPSVQTVAAAVSASADLRWRTENVPGVNIRGQSSEWPDYTQGEFIAGRNFTPTEEDRASSVVVLTEDLAESLFEGINPIGQDVRLSGELFRVVGVYRPRPNIFSGNAEVWAVVPPTVAVKRLNANDEWLSLLVVPKAGYTQEQAMDEVTVALRTARGLRPADENNFALIRQEAISNMVGRFTGIFALVMLVLSSIGLMVGGVGVVAIMMISVTERTREIGVRKALGATRTEILWQFLVEAMTVTVIGGLIGMMIGGGGALLLSALTPLPASVPLWSIAAALAVSAVTGIGFGLYPANKAARLDPVDALRYE